MDERLYKYGSWRVENDELLWGSGTANSYKYTIKEKSLLLENSAQRFEWTKLSFN